VTDEVSAPVEIPPFEVPVQPVGETMQEEVRIGSVVQEIIAEPPFTIESESAPFASMSPVALGQLEFGGEETLQ
jgi:hypothetical protein